MMQPHRAHHEAGTRPRGEEGRLGRSVLALPQERSCRGSARASRRDRGLAPAAGPKGPTLGARAPGPTGLDRSRCFGVLGGKRPQTVAARNRPAYGLSMSDILTRIIQYKREEVAAAQAARPLHEVELAAHAAPPVRGFAAAVERTIADGRFALIAEIKKASPSK